MHFVIDGVKYPAVAIPKTGGGQTWATVDMGAYFFAFNSYHTVSLVWDTGGVSVNWWQVRTVQLPDGLYNVVTWQTGSILKEQLWYLHGLGNGSYTLSYRFHNTIIGAAQSSQPWRVTILPDGFCSLRPTSERFNVDSAMQECSFIPIGKKLRLND